MTRAAIKTLMLEKLADNTPQKVLWYFFYFFYLHISAFYGLYLMTTTASGKTTSLYLPLLIFSSYCLQKY
jgi:hypothetical protein